MAAKRPHPSGGRPRHGGRQPRQAGGQPRQPGAWTSPQPSSGGKQTATQAVVLWTVLAGVVVGCCVLGMINRDDGSTVVPPPADVESSATVPILARAAEQHGICYGWKLVDGSRTVSVGSNLGEGRAADEGGDCPRWVVVEAAVDYTPSSSERSDSASVRVLASPTLDDLRVSSLRAGLTRFGLSPDVFVDDPGWAVTRAATMLPLLVAETGLVEPLATTSPVPAEQVPPLAGAGNDLWRDRWGQLLTVAGLLLVAVVLIVVGLVQRHRQRPPRQTPPPGYRPSGPPGQVPPPGQGPYLPPPGRR
ncbi:hypothetical protein ABT336_12945 [Micromonospora sp. NPDC000207]|uniref:hypothetical protein n=1 Tax=Micromonospora sp. NPDC000207 TaxID=3154246 RepID=UPI0033242AEF